MEPDTAANAMSTESCHCKHEDRHHCVAEGICIPQEFLRLATCTEIHREYNTNDYPSYKGEAKVLQFQVVPAASVCAIEVSRSTLLEGLSDARKSLRPSLSVTSSAEPLRLTCRYRLIKAWESLEAGNKDGFLKPTVSGHRESR
jgi:hypothetical protein